MNRRRSLTILLFGVLASQSAWAGSLDRWERRQERRERLEERLGNSLSPGMQQASPSISPGDAARMAQERNGGGRVLDVVPTAGGWRVKLLKAGEVRTVLISDDGR